MCKASWIQAGCNVISTFNSIAVLSPVLEAYTCVPIKVYEVVHVASGPAEYGSLCYRMT